MSEPILPPLSEMVYHPTAEKLVDVICRKTRNDNRLFFRIQVAYYFTKIASMMRCHIRNVTSVRGKIPVNMYAINLMPSGDGKGHSQDLIEDFIIEPFREQFIERTWPMAGESNLPKIANKRAIRKATDPDEELERIQVEFDSKGALAFSFSEGSSPAVKQMRQLLLMADAGSMNLEMDEIGANLIGNTEVLNLFLELYSGKTKQKLTKNSSDNKRTEELEGKTPTNMMLFGTPSALLDGAKVEEAFDAMLEMGYARRCFFSYSRNSSKQVAKTGKEWFESVMIEEDEDFLEDLGDRLAQLADFSNFNKSLQVSEENQILILEYGAQCAQRAQKLGTHKTVQKTELVNRYFKMASLAGVYAFIDGSPEIRQEHIYSAIALTEESGKAFMDLLSRDRPYAKLARYIAEVGEDITQTDLMEDLPFFRGSQAAKSDMMNMAITWGYKNNVIIKKQYLDGIEFLRGESLKETDLSEVTVSYSDHQAYGYMNEKVPFDQLHKLTQAQGHHWTAHHVREGHRCEEKTLPGFNLLVIDVDGGVHMDTAKMLLKDFKFHMYTTKRHTSEEHRFRIVLPINFNLALDAQDYREFMEAVYDWLPFDVDRGAKDRCRKWLSHDGHYEYNDGVLVDALQFIPKTKKNEQRKERLVDQSSLNNLERWFVNHTGEGNRSNQLIKYALLLVDAGKSLDEVFSGVNELNEKLPQKLPEEEVQRTILQSASKAIIQRDSSQ